MSEQSVPAQLGRREGWRRPWVVGMCQVKTEPLHIKRRDGGLEQCARQSHTQMPPLLRAERQSESTCSCKQSDSVQPPYTDFKHGTPLDTRSVSLPNFFNFTAEERVLRQVCLAIDKLFPSQLPPFDIRSHLTNRLLKILETGNN